MPRGVKGSGPYSKYKNVNAGKKGRKAAAAAAPSAAANLTHLTDLTQVGLVGVYWVQTLGMPCVDEILEKCRDICGLDIDKRDLSRSLRGAQSRGFIAIEKQDMPGRGHVNCYKMKTAAWKNPPEAAQLSHNFLPALLANPETKEIKGWFDSKEGAGEKKKSRGVDVGNYVSYHARVRLLDPILGSQIPNQFSKMIREQFPNDLDKSKTPVEGEFVRDPVNGDYLIPSDVLDAWWAGNCRYLNIPEARSGWVSFSPARITPKQKVMQIVLPVNSARGQPSAPKSYELIQPGEEFDIDFMAPSKGYMTPEQIEWLFITSGLRPKRGLSPARGRRYGRYIVLEFKCQGAVLTQPDLNFFLGDVHPDVLKEHGDYLKDAAKRLANVSFKDLMSSANGKNGDEEEPFPGGNGHSTVASDEAAAEA